MERMHVCMYLCVHILCLMAAIEIYIVFDILFHTVYIVFHDRCSSVPSDGASCLCATAHI